MEATGRLNGDVRSGIVICKEQDVNLLIAIKARSPGVRQRSVIHVFNNTMTIIYDNKNENLFITDFAHNDTHTRKKTKNKQQQRGRSL